MKTKAYQEEDTLSI